MGASVILLPMETAPQRSDLLRKLKNYLLFLKDCGYTEIPQEIDLKIQSGKKRNPVPISPDSPAPETARPAAAIKDGSGPLAAIRQELGDCTRCKLCRGRKNIVFGSGNPNADLVFVGEGPGADEDEQGLPFVGRAGKKLTEIIEKGMGLNRERDTYICNIVKCRPPGNRDPEADEIAACKPFLIKQLRAIQPRAIVALGKPAASTLLGRSVPITKERGTWHEFEGIQLMLTFHPAYLLRFYTLENRRAVLDDMKKVLEVLQK
ncbi:MAG: uracil-DNA glycosylase family protein [Nitrospinaceae bacterium]